MYDIYVMNYEMFFVKNTKVFEDFFKNVLIFFMIEVFKNSYENNIFYIYKVIMIKVIYLL